MTTKKEILQKLEALQKEVREWGEKKEWPDYSSSFWHFQGDGSLYRQSFVADKYAVGALSIGNCFRTKADAKLMAEWLKAQRLTWMPTEGEVSYWWDWDDDEAVECHSEYKYRDYYLIATGNCHKTKEEAESYGRLMKAVAKLKTDYLV